jgi:prepilin-type N-terminal cleavage/methylation domain-containing protein
MILRKNDRRSIDRLGFTLMEVLVVCAILVILAGTASIAVFKFLEDAKVDKATLDIEALTKAAKTYSIKHGGQTPNGLEDVLPYLDGGSQSNLIDPWGNQYQYEVVPFNGQKTIHIFTKNPETDELIDVLKR